MFCYFYELFFFIDLFKSPLFLFLENKQKSSTFFGSILSLLIFLYLGITFSNSDVFYKFHPTIIDQTQSLNHHPLLSLNSSNFALSMGVVDSDGISSYDPTIASIVFLYNTINGEDVTNDYMDIHICNESDFPSDPGVLQSLRLDNNFCLDHPEINLEGYWNEQSLSYVEIALLTCQNSTSSNITCKSQDDINTFLKEKYFQIYFKEYNYDMTNLQNPTTSLFQTDYGLIDPEIRKKLVVTYKKMEIMDDQGLILDENKTMEAFQQDSGNWDFDTNTEDDQIIFVICLYSSGYQQKVSRRYQKLQEAFSSLGGSASILMMIGFALTKTKNKLNIANIIMNQLYSFQTIPKKASKRNKNKNKLNKRNIKNQAFEMQEKLYNDKNNENQSVKNKPRKRTDEAIPQKENFIPIKSVFGDETINQKMNINSNKIEETKEEINIFKIPNRVEQKEKVIVSMKVPNKNDLNDSFILENFSKKNIKLPPPSIPTNNREVLSPSLINMSPTNMIKSNRNNVIQKLTSKIFGEPTDLQRSTLNEYATSVQKESKQTMTIWEFVKLKVKKMLRFKLQPQEHLFYIAQKIFHKELDVINILKRLQDVEKLKMILLNENQLSIFELLAKPMIYMDEQQEQNMEMNESSYNRTIHHEKKVRKKEEEKIMKIKKILKTYNQTIHSDNLNEIDKRLLKLVDKNLQDFCMHYGSKKNIL